MTNEEQHQITGQIVHELAEARRMLVCLERKSEKMADDFGFIIEMLFGNLQVKDVQLAERYLCIKSTCSNQGSQRNQSSD